MLLVQAAMVVSGDDCDYGSAAAGKVVVFSRAGAGAGSAGLPGGGLGGASSPASGGGGASGRGDEGEVWLLSLSNPGHCANFMACMVSLVPRVRGESSFSPERLVPTPSPPAVGLAQSFLR